MITTILHPEYIAAATAWRKCRDCSEGEEAVQFAGVRYLPKLGDQTDPDYEAYKLRARFFNAFAKTISGHTGLILRTPINLITPDSFDEVKDNIDRSGSTIADYIKLVIEQVLTVGRHGTLIDYSRVEEGATKEDAAGARPYWVSYKAENILDWQYTDGILTYVVLREFLDKKDNFYKETQKLVRYRVLKLEGGVYTQQVYVEGEEDTDQEVGEVITPHINGKTFDHIPFTIHQPDHDNEVNKPPLLDLANTNISHYRVSADYYHGLHFVALPTPYVIGIDPDDGDAPTSIGPQKLWLIANDSAKVGLLEFSGAGLSAIKDALDDLKDDMALLGARMLLTEGAEKTATAAKLKSISETSDLAALVVVLNAQLNHMLETTILWAGVAGEGSVTVSTNFIPPDLDAQMLLALVKGWQDGAYPYETLVTNLQAGEIIDPNMDADELEGQVGTEGDERMAKEAAELAKLAPVVVEPIVPVGEE